MRKFLVTAAAVLILISLTCCNRQPADPFDDLWNASTDRAGWNSSAPSPAASSNAPVPSEPSEISLSSLPDETVPSEDDVSEPSSEAESSAQGNETSEPPAESSRETSRQNTSGTTSSGSNTSRTTSGSNTSRTTSGSNTSRTTSGSNTSRTTSGSNTSGTTSRPASSAPTSDQPSSGTSGDPGGNNSSEEPDDPPPVYTSQIPYDDLITIFLPDSWSVLKHSGTDFEAASDSRSQFLTASASGLGNASGLTEDEIFEVMLEEAQSEYTVEKGYAVSEGSVSLAGRKQKVITIQKSDGSELYRQVAYILSGDHLVTFTVMVTRSSAARNVWKFIDKV
ncbi:MAG: hypothetical protein II715_04830 [Clostridia bacterium]|nr:hypothetical protein [Clostridia bacterium]